MRRRRTNPLIFVAVALAVLITGWWQQRQHASPHGGTPASPPAGRAASPPPHSSPAPPTPSSDSASALDRVPESERDALLAALALIEQGGPFPHAKDGTVFSNREGALPSRPRGYYREYTVPTPGAKNRGARRVVQGKDGDTWYTNDHYRTFVRIDE
ncbi:MAG TPA: ribonuclease domain-containing protein [Thermoanaerobaculia bacterium]|nr:ribonuclease domain-containing protein [Thermoanaerobaculia bacterium]